MVSEHRREIKVDGFELRSGEEIPLTIEFETYGDLDRSRSNAILICHSLTHSSHVAKHDEDDEEGWWTSMVGPGKYIDTEEYFVVCVNVPGSCYGTTGPSSIDPGNGEPYGSDFPEITISDMVRAQKLVIDHLEIDELKSIIGGSIGGQQALEWSKLYPSIVKSIIPIATGARVSPMMLGFGYISQNAIRSDPNWSGGDYYGGNRSPEYGLQIARQIGHLTYLSREGVERKFGREKSQEESDHEFEIESYLRYQGEKFVERFDPNSYLYLTEAMHNFDLSKGYSSDFQAVKEFDGLVYLMSIDSDWHFTVEESEYLAEVYEKTDSLVMHDTIKSPYGHDAFLVENEKLGKKIRLFLEYMFEGEFDSSVN
ncbi:MAG: homoserine O-acetyltransferase [Candidatus Thermoplasmatota archaeon]